MNDIKRRGLLAGLVTGGAALSGTAMAQQIASPEAATPPLPTLELAPQTDPVRLQTPAVPVACKPPVDWANVKRYAAANAISATLPASQRKVVFIGDSLTDNWPHMAYQPELFLQNGFVGRGISGQTSDKMLVRFWPDVVALKPKAVHILTGTNDIAENGGPYDPAATAGAISAMGSIAKANRIKVVIGSALPAASFPWRKELGNPTPKIRQLNTWLKAYCASQGFIYADYWQVLSDGKDAMQTSLGRTGSIPIAPDIWLWHRSHWRHLRRRSNDGLWSLKRRQFRTISFKSAPG